MHPQEIKTLIAQSLPDAEVEVIDTVGDGNHFQAVVISEQFAGLTMIKQHQRVYAALQDYLNDGRLHALALKTYTPSQWQSSQA